MWSLRPKVLALGLVIVAGFPSAAAQAAELTGIVTHVRDGDTIEIDSTPIRLSGLHAPELDSQAGKRAAEFMQNLVLHKSVRCRLNGE